ncbi:MAG TPA: tetratricopeptide repeat protein [Acidimicrobiales bacterium]
MNDPYPSDRQALEEERDFCLRSLQDLDAEFEAGDIDEADYDSLRQAYTARAASVLRALAADDGAGVYDEVIAMHHDVAPVARLDGFVAWRRRVGVGIAAVVVAAGACWVVVASSATRLPGQEITGEALGSQAVAQQLAKASKAESSGDQLSAVKDYQAILSSYPNQPEALTGEGWLLAETQQPALLKQGLSMLSNAEKVEPGYAPAHVYRGIALLSEGDYASAIPELQWYLDHNPDPQLAPRVRQALRDAQTKAGQEGG